MYEDVENEKQLVPTTGQSMLEPQDQHRPIYLQLNSNRTHDIGQLLEFSASWSDDYQIWQSDTWMRKVTMWKKMATQVERTPLWPKYYGQGWHLSEKKI